MQTHSSSNSAFELPADGSAERLTQRELARKLGVSQATISRALSGNRRHSEETRSGVLDAAANMGYRPDPALSSLNAYRRTRRPLSSGQSLVWLGSNGSSDLLFEYAASYAAHLGYRMEHSALQNEQATDSTLLKSLCAQGAVGLIFSGNLPHALDLSDFAAVQICTPWQDVQPLTIPPQIDCVAPDHFQAALQCLQIAKSRGYRRIGLVLGESTTPHIDDLHLAALFLHQQRTPQLPALPPLLHSGKLAPKDFHHWLKAHKPDALLTTEANNGCLHQLQELGQEVPQAIAVALLGCPQADAALARFSGSRHSTENLARCAVDMLIARIRNNQRGIRTDARTHLLPAIWQEGETLPALSVQAVQFPVPEQTPATVGIQAATQAKRQKAQQPKPAGKRSRPAVERTAGHRTTAEHMTAKAAQAPAPLPQYEAEDNDLPDHLL